MSTSQVASAYTSLRSQQRSDEQFEADKLLWHSEAIHSWLRGDFVVPVTLELDVSLVCNDRCPRCVHAFAHSPRYLGLEQIRQLLSEASSLGVRGLTLSGGGEPLAHPDILKIAAAIRNTSLESGLITNGGLVRSRDLAIALVSTFRWIRVSLDAASERQFRFVRGIKGIEKRLECLRRLQAARASTGSSCTLGVSFLTSSAGAGDIVPAASLARDLGFDYIQFKPKIHWSQDQHHRSSGLSQSGVFERILEARALETSSFGVLMSGKKYSSEALDHEVRYGQFHSAWFIAAVGPSKYGTTVMPTLYLDCSAKYLPRWTIGEFDALSTILRSSERRRMIEATSSAQYCIPAEKHSAYNVTLQSLRDQHTLSPVRLGELEKLRPANVTHPASL